MQCESGCGRTVRQSPAGGGQRKHCEVCRPPRVRKPKADPAPAAPAEAPAGGQMVARTTDKLRAAGRLDTIEGALLLAIARRMDSCESDTQFAALAGQYRQAIPAALPGQDDAADGIDQLAARRAAKRKAAGA